MTTYETTMSAPARNNARKAPRYFRWSAYAVPLLILTGFGLVTTLPIALMTYGVIRDARVRALRWWVGITTALFAVPFTAWMLRDNPQASLSSLLDPVMATLIIISSLVVVAKVIRNHR